MEQTQDIKRELVIIFFSQIRIILGVTLLIFAGAVAVAFLWPPTYAATGTILVKGKKVERSLEDLQETQLRAMDVTKEDLYSEAQLITSPTVINRAVAALSETGFYPVDLTREDQGSLAGKIGKNLQIDVVPASNVLRVSYYDKNMQAPAKVLDALLRQYISYRLEVYNPDETEVFFSSLVAKYTRGLDEKENELFKLIEKTKGADPQKAIEKNLLILQDLEIKRNVLQTEAIERELMVSRLNKALESENVQFYSFVENLVLQNLSAKLIDLVAEVSNIERVYNSESVKVKSYKDQIAKMHKSLRDEVVAIRENVLSELDVKRRQKQDIEQQIAAIEAQNIELQRFFILSNKVNREINILQYSYNNFTKRAEEANINSNEGSNLSSYVTIFGRPVPSDSPVFPKKKIVIPFGLLVGFITGISIGFVREFLDHTFKNPRDAMQVTGQPLLLSIPEWVDDKA